LIDLRRSQLLVDLRTGNAMAETALSASEIYRARPTLRLAGAEDERTSELLIGMRMEDPRAA
jgi:hypothetical protein